MPSPADLPRDIGEFIRDLRQSARISLRELAERAGVSNPYLSQIERGLRRPSAGILQQLARALHISAETLYVRAGMLDHERSGPADDLVEAIRRTADLDDEHKRTLIHIYESFRAERAARLERAAKAERPSRLERTRARARRTPDADGTAVPVAAAGVPAAGEEGESPPEVGG